MSSFVVFLFSESKICPFHHTILLFDDTQAYYLSFLRPPSLPMLYYLDTRADDVISDDLFTTKFTFVQSSANSKLRFRVAQYGLNGEFLGLTDVLSGRMQLCAGTDQRLDAAFTFGTYYSQNVSMLITCSWNTCIATCLHDWKYLPKPGPNMLWPTFQLVAVLPKSLPLKLCKPLLIQPPTECINTQITSPV